MHFFSDEETKEWASLYALGALSQAEARAFEEHMAEGCTACSAQLRGFEEVTSALSLGCAEAAPPARVREQLLSLIADDARSKSQTLRAAPLPFLTLRADEGQWYEVSEGITVKELFVDPQTGMVTSLFKMQPGARVPLHRHRGIEQCYIVEGDFHADNQALGAGDFHCAPAGSVHEPVYTTNGALLLIVAPESYEPLKRH